MSRKKSPILYYYMHFIYMRSYKQKMYVKMYKQFMYFIFCKKHPITLYL